MDNTNVIELNGKRYDAVTGKYLGKGHAKPSFANHSAGASRTIDGVVRPAARPHTTITSSQPVALPPKAARNHTPAHAAAHQPQHAKTLMRHVVNKPKPIAKPVKTKQLDRAPSHSLAIKESVSRVNPYRQQRANLARQHQHVSRFQSQPTRAALEPIASRQPVTGQQTARQQPKAPAKQDYNSLFEAAIAHATSHEQPSPRVAKKHHRGRRLMHATIAILVVAVLGGAVAWTQRSQIELQVASWQAGFDVRMPDYALTDYKRSAISQEHGSVFMSYQSGDRKYQITQQRSNWNSQTLLDQSVAGASTDEPQVIENKGRIIYIYGSNVSWVDGGIRYDITGNAPLTTGDAISIVDSM